MNFDESGNETVLISSGAFYPKVMIMITRGVSSLDVLILVNLEYLGLNALYTHYLVSRLFPTKSTIKIYFLFFYFPSTILSNII